MSINIYVRDLIGDFYKGNADRDRFKVDEAVSGLNALLKSGEARNADFFEYFNDMYSGRTAYNTLLNVIDYPVESIIRELLQNAFDCCYDSPDIKLAVNFKADEYVISISYNEIGFTLEQFMYYLSFGRNSGDLTHEGRFGIGAKSVFMNAEWLSMRSNNFSFKISNDHGLLNINEVNVKNPVFKGTEINIKVDSEQFRKIKENFLTLTEKKGLYINFIELCFAFNRKKILNADSGECRERTFNIAVLEDGKLGTVYKIQNHINSVAGIEVVRFLQNKKSVIDLICYENDGYVFLVPFAISNSKRRCLVKVLMEKYNYFSTYELTGLLKSANTQLPYEKFSAFFISVPNRCITPSRTGIRHDSEFEVSQKVEESLLDFIKKYKSFFILELLPYPNREGFYYLRPDSYAFEFVKNFILSSSLVKNIRNKFQDNISVLFPEETEPVPYGELKKSAYLAPLKTTPESFHLDGSAYQKYIRNELDAMEKYLSGYGDKTLYAAYEWTKETDDGRLPEFPETEDEDFEPYRAYTYEFYRGDKKYVIDSRINPALSDYNLYVHFSSLTERLLSNFFAGYEIGRKLKDETVMSELFVLFDKLYGEDYKVVMRYSQFYFSHSEEVYTVDFSHMKIYNIKNVMDCIEEHRYHFDTYQSYSDTVNIIMKFFTEGKETVDFLRQIKEQGGEVTLQLDLNQKYRFSAYGNQFMIPAKATNKELLDIIDDVNILIKNGMLGGKSFDFKYYKGRYAFDKESVTEILKDVFGESHIASVLAKIYVSDLKIDRIALLDGEDNIIDIISEKTEITREQREAAVKYIVLRDDYTKPEFADILEFIITGSASGKLSKFYTAAHESNQALPDQIPFYMKPLPTITKEEFDYLRNMIKQLRPYRDGKAYRNYFAKDVNSKLFGYSGICPFCDFETNIINGFNLRDFKVGLFPGEQEKYFQLSLYLCANDIAVANGWVIESVCIGGMSPFLWLEEITKVSVIPSEFLFCTLGYREQITYGATVDAVSDTVISASSYSKEFILTPLMAAKWVEDNLYSDILN